MTGVRSRPSRVVQDRSQVSSAKVIAAACTATSASPGCGTGTGACSYTSCSGPPLVWARSAIIMSIGDLPCFFRNENRHGGRPAGPAGGLRR